MPRTQSASDLSQETRAECRLGFVVHTISVGRFDEFFDSNEDSNQYFRLVSGRTCIPIIVTLGSTQRCQLLAISSKYTIVCYNYR